MRITVNGKEYASVDEMPPEVRREYERAMGMLADRDGSGVPDIFERGETTASAEAGKPKVSVTTSSKYLVNGVEYEGWEEIPEDVREMLRQAGAGPDSLPAPDATGARRGLTFEKTFSTSRRWNALDRTDGGITIRMSWSTLLALLVAITVAAVVAWVIVR